MSEAALKIRSHKDADDVRQLNISMTVANHMLSVFGSLLRKPFSIPAPTYVSKPLPSLSSVDKARRVHFEEEQQRGAVSFKTNEEDDEEDSDDDALPSSNIVAGPPQVVEPEKKKKRSKIGPRREGEISGSESEGETKRDKKKRKKEQL